MRPLRSFLLLLIFLSCFTGLHYLFAGTSLFPSLREFLPEELFTLSEDKKEQAVPLPVSAPPVTEPVDSSSADTTSAFNPDFIFNNFLDSLYHSKSQIRIMYYGDSQLEGDRITSYMRQILRQNAGGTGPGLFLPVMPVMYTKTLWIRSSANWKRYNYLSFKNGEISHREFGPFMVICRYLAEGERSENQVKATVRIKPSSMADSSSSSYDKLRIFYRNSEGRVAISVRAGDMVVLNDTLKRDDAFNEISCPLHNSTDVQVEFSGNVSPDIYGLSIESKKGLVIDNIPQRGSAGLEFTMVSRSNLYDAYRALSPDLFILQYGLNIVRNVREDYSYYMKGLSRQIGQLKELSPGTPVLVVGLTDMAAKEGDSIRSFRNIPLIIEAQKSATASENSFFWNPYEAMGGPSSIIKWAERKPPLAQKDYVHFTYDGADTLAKMLVQSMFIPPQTVKPDTVKADTAEVTAGRDNNQVLQEKNVLPDKGSSGILDIIIKSLISYDPDHPMIFSSASFWIFLLIVLAGYSLIYRKLYIRNFYLLLASLFFYYKSGGLFLLLLIFVIIIDFTVGLLMGKSNRRTVRKLLILVSIISNLGILAYFKYTGFIVSSINSLFGTDFRVYDFLANISNSSLGTSFSISNIILPVGISFFTFQSLSYTIDVYRRKMKPVKNIFDFGFYVSFFPQLVAGPIVRASEFIPQIYSRYHLDKREFSHAVFLILKGLIKKIIISDFIAVNFIDRIFDAPSVYSGFENLMAIYGYGLQIYCDFSGYTDIAIGVGLLLGFRLPVNFNSPYKAVGISDFWKRWHISLSRWLKDYLYIPLGGNRKGWFRTNLNLIITMLLGGLWHGADLRFVIWGFLHGMGLVTDKLWTRITGVHEGKLMRALSVFITFQFVSFCWIFFRAPDIESIKIMLSQIFLNFSPGSYMTVIPAYSSVFLLIAAGYLIHFLPESLKESYRGLFIRIPVAAQLVFVMIVAVLLFQMRMTDTMPFIYFRF